ncbi:MAG: STAS domain-containing protein [Planctomycetota bacterium]|jgi:anti-sigma B factor antagonist
MFNKFGKKPEATSEPPPVEPPLLNTGSRAVTSPIAEIEQMGETMVATLTVTELSDDAGAARLADLLFELGQYRAKHYVLDIQNVQFMDSACLGCLVEALNLMAASGGKIALANAEHAVASLFRLTRLDRVFPICSDVMSALEAVEGKPEE